MSVNYKISGIGKALCELNNETLQENAHHDEIMNNPDFSHLYILKTVRRIRELFIWRIKIVTCNSFHIVNVRPL